MDFKNLNFSGKAALAPMAGFCDTVMRQVADRAGAAFTVSEMVSARALNYGDKKSLTLMATRPHKGAYGIQLFGFDPADFSVAVGKALKFKPDFIDINMGCPAPKITSTGAGSALMKNLPLAYDIVKATVDAAGDTPVSVKMRKGWDDECVSCVQLAQLCQKAGAAFVTVHARTRQQMYTPGIDMDIISRVKQAVDIPVIGNGDIVKSADAVNMMEKTGCDMVMVGRQALSRPWIFSGINRLCEGREIPPEPTIEKRMELLLWHIQQLCAENGEYLGMRKARGQSALYMKGLKGAARLRNLTNNLTYLKDAEALVEEVLKENGYV